MPEGNLLGDGLLEGGLTGSNLPEDDLFRDIVLPEGRLIGACSLRRLHPGVTSADIVVVHVSPVVSADKIHTITSVVAFG